MTGLDAVLRRTPLQAVSRLAHRGRLAVLAYHDVPDRAAFGRQLDVVCELLRPVTVAELLADDIPDGAVLITFDDGDPTVLTQALPETRARGLEGICFVVAGLIGTTTPCWWQEVEAHLGPEAAAEIRRLKSVPDAERVATLAELRAGSGGPLPVRAQLDARDLATLRAGGIEIGNHSLTHPCLDRCDDATVSHEIRGAHQRLTELLGRPPELFAYPNGNWDPRVERELEGLGYRAAFLFDHRHDRRAPAHPLRRSRLRMNPEAGPDRVRIILSGLHPFMHRARGRR